MKRRPRTPQRQSRLRALKDVPFFAASMINGVLALNGPLLASVAPLWILQRTDAPAVVISVVMLINMVTTVALQVPASHGSEDLPGAARVQRRGGLALALCCAFFAVSEATSHAATIVVIVAATLALTAGELFASASSWGVSYTAAPDESRGEYLAVWSLGGQITWAAGPVAMTTLAMKYGAVGWTGIAALFILAGVISPKAIAWVGRTPRIAAGRSPDTATSLT